MKKILIISNTVSSYHSPIFKNLAKKNYVHAIYYKNDQYEDWYNKEYKTLIKKNRSLFKGYNFSIIKFENFFLKYINFIYQFLKIILRKQIDNIVIFGYDHAQYWTALLIGKILNKKILWRGEAIPKETGYLKRLIKKITLTIFFSLCDKIFYSCEKNKKFLKNYTNKILYPYPCSVDNDYFRKNYYKLKKDKKKIIKQFNLKNNTFKITSVCRFTKRKNLSTLLKEIYFSKIKNIEVLLVGDGPEMKNLNEISKKYQLNVRFFGYKNQKEICKILSISDLYCLISNFGASPKSINEALNFKLPVITRDTVGTAGDLVIDSFNGYIINKNDDLRKKIKFITKQKKIYKFLKKNTFNNLDNFFSHKICEKNIIEQCK